MIKLLILLLFSINLVACGCHEKQIVDEKFITGACYSVDNIAMKVLLVGTYSTKLMDLTGTKYLVPHITVGKINRVDCDMFTWKKEEGVE